MMQLYLSPTRRSLERQPGWTREVEMSLLGLYAVLNPREKRYGKADELESINYDLIERADVILGYLSQDDVTASTMMFEFGYAMGIRLSARKPQLILVAPDGVFDETLHIFAYVDATFQSVTTAIEYLKNTHSK